MQVGLLTLLFVLFLGLKLAGIIAWSWWWVCAPLWIGFIVFLVVVVLGILVAAVAGAKRQRRHW